MLALQTNIKEALSDLDLLTHYKKNKLNLHILREGKCFSSNFANIFLLVVNFENLIVVVHFIIISFML